MQLSILVAGAKGWRAGHECVRRGEFVPKQTQFDRPEKDLLDFAAQRARVYAADAERELNLTPAERVKIFFIYMRGFAGGVMNESRCQAPGNDDKG